MSIAIKALPCHEEMVSNILKVYADANPSDVAEGLEWYAQANRLAQSLAAGTSYTIEQTAGIIAAISPRLHWSKNTIYPAHILRYHASANRNVETWRAGEQGMSVTYKRREDALRILDGADPAEILGQKTWAFYCNILGDSEEVTVDVWATKIVMGDPNLYDSPSRPAYSRIADAYRDAADAIGISPRALQAATWVAYRKLYGYGG